MKKIHICRVVFEFAPGTGGSITHTIELSKHISKYLRYQMILAPKPEEDSLGIDNSFPFGVLRLKYCKFTMIQIIKRKLVPWFPVVPLIHISYGIKVIQKIIQLDKTLRIDIIHAHGIGSGIAATIAGWITNKPVIWMLHGTCLAYSGASGFYETLITTIFKPSHLLMLNEGSPAPRKFKKLLKENATIVNHGIDISLFKPLSKSSTIKRNLGLKPNDFVIFSPHSLILVKGQEYAIKAFSCFINLWGSSNSLLIISGSGSLKAELGKIVEKSKYAESIIFKDSMPIVEMTEYYAIADVVLATSNYSNLNRTVQEAMACGIPVVAFNSGGTRQVVIHGQTGFLAEPCDIKSLAKQLRKLYRNPELKYKLGKNAREFIIRNRDWESRIKTELAIYDKVLKEK